MESLCDAEDLACCIWDTQQALSALVLCALLLRGLLVVSNMPTCSLPSAPNLHYFLPCIFQAF